MYHRQSLLSTTIVQLFRYYLLTVLSGLRLMIAGGCPRPLIVRCETQTIVVRLRLLCSLLIGQRGRLMTVVIRFLLVLLLSAPRDLWTIAAFWFPHRLPRSDK